MARDADAAALAAAAARGGEVLHLLELEFGGGTVRFTTGPHDVTWDGALYAAAGGGFAFGAVGETTDARGQRLALAFSGVSQVAITALLGEDYIGREGRLWRARVLPGHRLGAPGGQLVAEPDDFGQWAPRYTPTRTGGQPDPWGGTTAWLIGDNDGALSEGYIWYTPPLTPGPKAFAFYNKPFTPGVGPSFLVREPDDATARFLAHIHYAADGVPTVTCPTGEVLAALPDEDGWWLFLCRTAPVTGGTGYVLNPRIAADNAAAVGSAYFFHVQLWDTPYPQGPEPMLLFRGLMNAPWRVRENIDAGTARVETELVGPLALLDQVAGITADRNSHQRHYPRDTFFRHIAEKPHGDFGWGVLDALPGK